MRDWKNWLFPLLACLAVLALALLPRRLSLLEDGKLSGVVHNEELGEDSNFPAKPPDLPERIWLMARASSLPDGLSAVEQELEGAALEEAALLAAAELHRLEEADILPEGTAALFDGCEGNRVYLRNQSDLSSAAFLELNSYRKDVYFWLYLDLESGRLLSLEIIAPLLTNYLMDTASTGRAYLDSLGLEYELLNTGQALSKGDGESLFRLPDSYILYTVRKSWDSLGILPGLDWEHLDKQAAAGEIMDSSIQAALGYGPYDRWGG